MSATRIFAAVAILTLVSLPACYSHQPLIGELPAPGDNVRVRLAAPAASEISERVGQPLRSVQGTVLSANPDSLRLNVSWGAIYAGTAFAGRRDILTFAGPDVLEIDRREFSRARTVLLGVGAGGVLALVMRGFRRGGGTSPTNGNGGPPF